MRMFGGLVALLLVMTVAPVGAADYQIVGGRPASPGEYPAMAALIDTEFGQFCGGTLVDAEWVVTAAHCFYDPRTGGSQIPPEVLEVALDTTDWTVGGERIGVTQIVLHPDYDDLRTVNDLALLRLARPADTLPAPLVAPDGEALYAPGREAVVTGYGATTPRGEAPSQQLLEVEVPLVADQDCATAYDLVADRHVCAGDPGTEDDPGPDTCQGDSGGPLWTDRGDGVLALIGVTSFGGLCGVDAPGVYTELRTYLQWVGGIIDGSIAPDAPTDPTLPPVPADGEAPPLRISAGEPSDPVAQAIAVSEQAFVEGQAPYAVVATAARYPDALGGSALAYGIAPLLYTGPDGLLSPATTAELQRAVPAGATVYVLGGSAAVDPAVDAQLVELGYVPVRLAGSGREATAVAVADEVVARFGGDLPLDTVVVATGADWPDAVTAGQVGAWWGVPILLTPADGLNQATAAALARLGPRRVLVPGGVEAIDEATFAAIAAASGAVEVVRLGGPTRFETAAEVTRYNLRELYGATAPRYAVVVNLRRGDAYAHVLAASVITGLAGVFVPVEGESGDVVPPAVLDGICGQDLQVVVVGGTDLVAEAAADRVRAASVGEGCDPTLSLRPGEAVRAALTEVLPIRDVRVDGQAGQTLRIRMDAPVDQPFPPVDPLVEVIGPDGSVLAGNDDGPEGTLNAFLEVTLPQTGTYTIRAGSFSEGYGAFLLSVDPAPLATDAGVLSAQQPEAAYPLQVAAGARVVVEMRRPDPDVVTDPLLVALDEAGRELAIDDDGGLFPNARLSFVAPGGPVTIVATAFGDAYGPYTLAIMAPDGGVTAG